MWRFDSRKLNCISHLTTGTRLSKTKWYYCIQTTYSVTFEANRIQSGVSRCHKVIGYPWIDLLSIIQNTYYCLRHQEASRTAINTAPYGMYCLNLYIIVEYTLQNVHSPEFHPTYVHDDSTSEQLRQDYNPTGVWCGFVVIPWKTFRAAGHRSQVRSWTRCFFFAWVLIFSTAKRG